jgi:hypothetical protein
MASRPAIDSSTVFGALKKACVLPWPSVSVGSRIRSDRFGSWSASNSRAVILAVLRNAGCVVTSRTRSP